MTSSTKDWEEKYNQLCTDIASRDYHLIVAMTATTSLLDPNYEPAKPNDLTEVVKELVHKALKMELESTKVDSKYKQWNDSMEMLSQWNEELEQEVDSLKDENQRLKSQLSGAKR